MSFTSSVFVSMTMTFKTPSAHPGVRGGGGRRRRGTPSVIATANPVIVNNTSGGASVGIAANRPTRGTIPTTSLAPTAPINGTSTSVPNCMRVSLGRVPNRMCTLVKDNGLIVSVKGSRFGVAGVATGTNNTLNCRSNGTITCYALSPSRSCRTVRGTSDCTLGLCTPGRAAPSTIVRYGGLTSRAAPRTNRPHACINRVIGLLVGGWDESRR